MTLTEHLTSIGACYPAVRWSRGKTAREAWATCTNPEWGIWWVCCMRGFAAVEPVVRRAVLRAARGYAANSMERAGLYEHASTLSSLPSTATFREILVAANEAGAAYATSGSYHAACAAAGAAAGGSCEAVYYAAAAGGSVGGAGRAAEKRYQLSDLRELCSPPWTEEDE